MGPGIRRFDQRDADAELAHLMLQGFRQPLHSMLGGRIKSHVRSRKKAEHGTDIDDSSVTLRSHVREYCPCRAQYAEYVGIEQRPGLGDRCFLHCADHVHSRVVDEYVDAAAPGDDGLDSKLDGSVVANVHLDQLNAGQWGRLGDAAHSAEYAATPLGKLLCGGTSDAR